MDKRKVWIASIMLTLITSLLISHLDAPVAWARPQPAYLTVTHSTSNDNVAVTAGYKVEYRRYIKQEGRWEETWTDRTNAAASDYVCSHGTYKWRYETEALDSTLYPAVEWRVTIGYGRTGTRCSDGATVTYLDSTPLNNQTRPGYTAVLTAAGYWW